MSSLKKKLAFGICIIFIISSVAACSKGSDSAKNTTGNTQSSSTIYGKVTKIDKKEVTLALGDMSRDNKGGAVPSGMPQGGAIPSGMPQGGGQKGDKNSGAFPSGMPQGGGQKGDKNGGAFPSGMPQGPGQNGRQPGGMGGSFTENGETLVITVADESLIKLQSGNQETEGSLNDITVGSIITVEYSNDKDISAIIVHSTDKPDKPDAKSNSSSDSSKQ